MTQPVGIRQPLLCDTQCLLDEPMNETAIVEGMDVIQGFDGDLPSHRLTWLPTLLSAHQQKPQCVTVS